MAINRYHDIKKIMGLANIIYSWLRIFNFHQMPRILTAQFHNNTALLFNKSLNFFHGFYLIAKGKSRKAIGAIFTDAND